MQAKRPSIVDVASLAKVSKQTVSRVINDSPNVSDRTARARVLAAIAELGFRRSELARSFSSGRTIRWGSSGAISATLVPEPTWAWCRRHRAWAIRCCTRR